MERVANDISGKYHGRPNVTFFFPFLLSFFFFSFTAEYHLERLQVNWQTNRQRTLSFLLFPFFKDLSKETDDVVPRLEFFHVILDTGSKRSERESREAQVGFDFASKKALHAAARHVHGYLFVETRVNRREHETITRHSMCVKALYLIFDIKRATTIGHGTRPPLFIWLNRL